MRNRKERGKIQKGGGVERNRNPDTGTVIMIYYARKKIYFQQNKKINLILY